MSGAWAPLLVAALLAGLCEACPTNRPDIVCIQGAGIDGDPLPAPLAKETSTACGSPAGVNELTLTVNADVRIRDMDVLLSIDHYDLTELKIDLEGPTGVTQTLIDYGTIKGSDLVMTILDDEATTSGLLWKVAGSTKLAQGRELTNAALSEALTQTTTFTQEQWDAFGIDDLRAYDYIKGGDNYYQPSHTADLSAATSLYTGRWKITDGSLSAWDGTNARGKWSLRVWDCIACLDRRDWCSYNQRNGILQLWELRITPASFCDPPHFQNTIADGAGGQASTCVDSCPGWCTSAFRLSAADMAIRIVFRL